MTNTIREPAGGLLYEATQSPQPATYTGESVDRIIRSLFDSRDPDHPAARMTAPDDYVMSGRLIFAVTSVCAGLGATLPIRAITNDFDSVAEPVTEIGKHHHAWVRERGLPTALEHHDHP